MDFMQANKYEIVNVLKNDEDISQIWLNETEFYKTALSEAKLSAQGVKDDPYIQLPAGVADPEPYYREMNEEELEEAMREAADDAVSVLWDRFYPVRLTYNEERDWYWFLCGVTNCDYTNPERRASELFKKYRKYVVEHALEDL